MKNLKLLFRFLKGNQRFFLLAVVCICFAAVFSTVIPIITKTTIDSVIGSKPMELPSFIRKFVDWIGGRPELNKNLWICGLVLLAFTAVHGVFLFLKGRLSALASENSAKRIKEEVYNHILHLPFDYHVKAQAGDLIQRCTSDVETIQNFVSSQFVEMGQSIITFIMVILLMISMDPLYFLASVALIPIIFVTTLLFFNSMKKVFRVADEAEGSMTACLQENLTGVRVVKAFGAQAFETEKFEAKNKEYRDSVYKIIILMSRFWSSTDFLCMVQFGFVLLLGVYWVNTGRCSLGTVVAFTSYAGMLIWPIRQLGQMMAFAGQAFVSLNRVQEILDAPLEKPCGPEARPKIHGDIEFRHVGFEYAQGHPVLNDLSFHIKKGQTAAFLGATGSGKSSLLHLLVRLYDYQEGSILLDGVELKNMERHWLRKHVGLVLQEPFLFSKSIRDNIRMGKADAHEHEIHASSHIAAIHDTILDFEKGYDTVIGERGVTLSGGQRQRLAIARAVIGSYPILIFDDSLSAVDMETDAAIRKALRKKNRDATTLIISHRITTLAEADVIFVLENGKITQQGTHEQLLQKPGLYKRVWDLQSAMDSDIDDVTESVIEDVTEQEGLK